MLSSSVVFSESFLSVFTPILLVCPQTEEKERWRGEYMKLRDAMVRFVASRAPRCTALRGST